MTTIEEASEIAGILSTNPPRFVRATFAVLVALVGAGVAWATLTRADQVAVAPGQVRSSGDLARVQTPRAGTLAEVTARPGDRVREGQLLAKLDDSTLRVEKQKLERIVEGKRREIQELVSLRRIADGEAQSERRRAEAALKVARTSLVQQERAETRRVRLRTNELAIEREKLQKASTELESAKTLFQDQLVSELDLRNSESNVAQLKTRVSSAERVAERDETLIDLAREEVASAKEAVQLADERSRVRIQELELRRVHGEAELTGLEKDLERVEHDLGRCEVRAPIAGLVVEGEPQSGDVVEAGSLLYRVAPIGRLRFDALVPNSEIAGIHVGQKVNIKLDAYPFQQYGVLEGRVAYVSKDATQSGRGLGTSYEIRVDLPILKGEDTPTLELGMAGRAEIVRGRERLIVLACRKLRSDVRF